MDSRATINVREGYSIYGSTFGNDARFTYNNETVVNTLAPFGQNFPLRLAPPHVLENFVGRASELETFKEDLLTAKTLVISGFGGMGKSSIAKKMAHDLYHDNLCCGVVWVEVHKDFQLQKELYHLGQLILPPYESRVSKDDNVNHLENRLRNSLIDALENRCTAPCKRLLVILDDVWRTTIRLAEDFLAVFPVGTLLLVTTRDSGLAKDFSYKGESQTLHRMDLDDGQKLLETYLVDVSPTLLRSLAKVIKGHPLAMAIAAKRVSWRESQEKHVKRHIEEYSSLSTTLDSISLDSNLVGASELDRVLRSSYLDLEPAEQLIYRALGVIAEDSYFSMEMVAKMIAIDIDQTEESFQRLVRVGLLQKVPSDWRFYGKVLWCQHPLLTADANRLAKNDQGVQWLEAQYQNVVIEFMNLSSRTLDLKHISCVGKRLISQFTADLPQIQWKDPSSNLSTVTQWLVSMPEENSKNTLMGSLTDFIDAFVSLPRYQQHHVDFSARVCLIPELVGTFLASEAILSHNLSVQQIKNVHERWTPLVDRFRKSNMPSMNFAIREQDVDAVKLLLLVCNKNINVHDENGATPLHHAAATGNFDIVNDLLKLGKAKVDSRDFMDKTPLHYAANSMHINIIELLLGKGADVNAKGIFGETAIYILAIRRCFTSTQRLVNEYGADVHAILTNGGTLLHLDRHESEHKVQPKEGNRIDFTKWLVEQHSFDINAQKIDGCTPLHDLLKHGYIDIAEMLLNTFKARIDIKSANGTTPLHIAIQHSTLDVVQLLISKLGADVCSRTVRGETMLHFAMQNRKCAVKIIQWLVNEHKMNINSKTYRGLTPLCIGLQVNSDNLAFLQYLVEDHHVDLSLRDSYGNLALYYAIKGNDVKVIEYLIEHTNINNEGAAIWDEIFSLVENIEIGKWIIKKYELDINLNPIGKAKFLQNTAWNATQEGYENSINILQQLVNDFNANLQEIIDDDGQTLLHFATKACNLELMRWLVEKHNLPVQAQTAQGYTLLHLIIEHYNNDCLDIVEWLVGQLKDDINLRTNDGQTILHLSLLYYKRYIYLEEDDILTVMQRLVYFHGADITAKTNAGETLVHFAASFGSSKIIKWLVTEHSLDTDARTNHAQTPLHYAARGQPIFFYTEHPFGNDVLSSCETVNWLVNMNYSDPEAMDDEGCTIFHLAARAGKINILRWVIFDSNLEMDIDVRDNASRTPLHHAAMGDCRILEHNLSMSLTVHYLVKWGADVNATTITGWTPLHFLSQNNDLGAMKILLRDSRPDINAKTDKGWTVLHFAAHGTFLDTVIWLLDDYKMDANSKDINGQTPIDIAAEKLEKAGEFNQKEYAVWKALSIAGRRQGDSIPEPVGPQVLHTSCNPSSALPTKTPVKRIVVANHSIYLTVSFAFILFLLPITYAYYYRQIYSYIFSQAVTPTSHST